MIDIAQHFRTRLLDFKHNFVENCLEKRLFIKTNYRILYSTCVNHMFFYIHKSRKNFNNLTTFDVDLILTGVTYTNKDMETLKKFNDKVG